MPLYKNLPPNCSFLVLQRIEPIACYLIHWKSAATVSSFIVDVRVTCLQTVCQCTSIVCHLMVEFAVYCATMIITTACIYNQSAVLHWQIWSNTLSYQKYGESVWWRQPYKQWQGGCCCFFNSPPSPDFICSCLLWQPQQQHTHCSSCDTCYA